MNTVVHITPQLPPAIDGVGDYCWNLWKHCREAECAWQFLVARGADDTRAAAPHAPVHEFALTERGLATALERVQCNCAVLHYVGYAYQPKGIPIWLPAALAKWRHRFPQRRLVVMFHEMYARSSPLRSPFWVAPFARRIIRQLVTLSDGWLTSCQRYFNQLVRDFGAAPELGRVVPIPSNIPPESRSPNSAKPPRKQRIVVFGLAKTRVWALERHWRLVQKLHRARLVEHVTLVGKKPDDEDERAWQRWADRIGEGVNWRKQFDLSAEEISRELAHHHIGLLANEPDILTKSGAFAAMATHGVVPVISVRGEAALPPNLHGAAFINDDMGTIPRLIELLNDSQQCVVRRKKLSEFAARELDWPRVARNWGEVLQLAAGAQPSEAPVAPAASPVLNALNLADLRPLQTGAALRRSRVEVSP